LCRIKNQALPPPHCPTIHTRDYLLFDQQKDVVLYFGLAVFCLFQAGVIFNRVVSFNFVVQSTKKHRRKHNC
jgi:hypothetical protein